MIGEPNASGSTSHCRETYRQAISERSAQREAFGLATQLLRARQLCLKPVEARRLVVKMLCYDPLAPHGNGGSLILSSLWSSRNEKKIA
jgi:hypothetical protein